MIAAWMAARGIPYVSVRYPPRRFKHWHPYFDLLSNVLTNATLPSISLGRHSFSLNWTGAPQAAFLKQCEPAQDSCARGQKDRHRVGAGTGVSVRFDLSGCRFF